MKDKKQKKTISEFLQESAVSGKDVVTVDSLNNYYYLILTNKLYGKQIVLELNTCELVYKSLKNGKHDFNLVLLLIITRAVSELDVIKKSLKDDYPTYVVRKIVYKNLYDDVMLLLNQYKFKNFVDGIGSLLDYYYVYKC